MQKFQNKIQKRKVQKSKILKNILRVKKNWCIVSDTSQSFWKEIVSEWQNIW